MVLPESSNESPRTARTTEEKLILSAEVLEIKSPPDRFI